MDLAVVWIFFSFIFHKLFFCMKVFLSAFVIDFCWMEKKRKGQGTGGRLKKGASLPISLCIC